MRTKDFNETFQSELQNPEFVEGFLQAALEEGTETFLLALQDVAKANIGMAQLVDKTSLQRESLYKTLSEQGNLQFRTMQSILHALGLRFSIERTDAHAA